MVAARGRELPPLQSVAEMTTAFEPPTRGAAPAASGAAPSVAGRVMEDGTGMLPDGTTWERTSGEERGKNGFWLRWTSLRGVSSSGKVQSRGRPLGQQQLRTCTALRYSPCAGGVGGALVGGERLGGHARDGRREGGLPRGWGCLARDLARGHCF